MSKSIRVSATCIAEIANSSPSSRLSKLRPFKFRDRGEGAGRSAYYKRTIDTVREFHRVGEAARIIRRSIEQLLVVENDLTLSRMVRTRARRNIEALTAYEDIYGGRHFKVEPNHRLALGVENVTITAQPDLWAVEDGTMVLIKIGAARNKSQDYVDLLLHVIRKAAIQSKYRIRARNVVYLNVESGEEIISQLPINHFNRKIRQTCREISELWPQIKE